MPACYVEGCKSRNGEGIRLFRIPTGEKNKIRREEWIRLIGRNTSLPENAKICELYFGEDEFERKREDGRRLLRPCAKPNLLEKHSEDMISNQEDTSNNTNKAKCEYDNSIINIEDSVCNIADTDVTTAILMSNSYNIHDEKFEILRNTACSNKDCENNTQYLQKTLKSLRQERRRLKKKLQTQNTNIEKVFNKDQSHFLTCNTQRGAEWSDDTLNKALKLCVACGQKGYEEVRRQNLPYPSIRTLQHRIQGFIFKPGILDDVFNMLDLKVSMIYYCTQLK